MIDDDGIDPLHLLLVCLAIFAFGLIGGEIAGALQ